MNLADIMRKAIQEEFAKTFIRAEVTGTDGAKVEIQRSYESTPDAQSWRRFASYSSPQVGDDVWAINVGHQTGKDHLIVLGTIVEDEE